MRALSSFVTLVLTGAIAVITLAVTVVPDLLNTFERWRQKGTMADMVAVGKEIERGQAPSIRKDRWGTPFQFRIAGSRYLIRSAASDRDFETRPAPVPPHTIAQDNFEADILFGNGAFLQYPEGIGLGAKGPQVEAPGPCERCHPPHPAMR